MIRNYYGESCEHEMESHCSRLTRREALRRAFLAAGGLLIGDWFVLPAAASAVAAPAKSVIQIWLWGGACHLDTFDPKPESGYDYCGSLSKALPTNVDGIQIGEMFTELSKQADKFSLIRSMTHDVNAHETASYMVQTGHKSGDGLVYPSAGAVVSLFKGYEAGYKGLIPPYIVLTESQGRFSEAGFLGTRYKPFLTGGDPAQNRFVVEGVVVEGISDERQRERRELLCKLNSLNQAVKGNALLDASEQYKNQAYDLILGDAGKVFDLSQETDEIRERYGRNTFGQSCLVARRLIERQVPYITINFKGWDTHKQHFQTMKQKLPQLDRGLAALLQDLSDRGLLGSTIVWCGGEFGRTPRVQWEPPWSGGRGHYGKVFSALIAGGGFRGGQVVGESDARGESVKNRPVSPADLIGTIYRQMGIDVNAMLPHPQGRSVRAMPDRLDGILTPGLLKEIASV